ncbi:putative U-box domain-containing protein 50 isoform X1 [Chenopodium quinoa]|uniref:putative U-box domain-containing protein 50 isoform X1 n=1 Tax=Chenopodium quinoa TaxID=63459 RepID=UPI000B77305D|nr:putative U-box domain-containing protein 50 isoform X1 [Chenopodium quinoa]XP_021728196.1 putative U-box domain-containing protein 50 isoform X1 [Chenopodium quinoa]
MMQLHEKIYVALSNEMQEEEGCLTLNWVIKKWGSHHPISIIILFINNSSSFEFVDTPFGKLPASSVSDDKIQMLRNCEQEKTDKLLSRYIAYCGKVKAEVHKINNHDEPIQKTVVDLIIEKKITKLVMGMTFMRSSSGRSKNAISGSFYVHRSKPDFCELFILSRGKLVMLKEENDEGYMEDEEGVIVAKYKQKTNFKGWLGKMLSHGQVNSPTYPSLRYSSLDSDSPLSRTVTNQWELYEQDIEEYLHELESNLKDEDKDDAEENNTNVQDMFVDCIQSPGERIEALKHDLQAARAMIELNKNAAKAEVDRQAKASWAICLCNHRAEQLQTQIAEEISTRTELTKDIDNTKEQIHEIQADVQESKDRLSSLVELQSELSSKLQVSSVAKREAEMKLENAANKRTELVREIEELRKQRDVFQRRIEFCKEKDAIGSANRMGDQVSCSHREFSADEIRSATDNFATYRRLAYGRNWTSEYKGRINRLSVVVKVLDSNVHMCQEFFQAKVNLLANLRHAQVTAFIGYCSELKCLVFEYMQNGCLRDIIFSRTKARALQWHQRIQIAAEVSLGLRFLHLAKPMPIVCSELNPSTIFLDRNFVAKLHSFEVRPSPDEFHECDMQADVVAFGDLLLQLLMGRNWARLDHEAMIIDNKQVILEALDENAGDWPLDLVEEAVKLAMKCRSINSEPNVGEIMSSVTEELNGLKKKADDVITKREYHMGSEDGTSSGEEWSHVPSNFLCPLLQVVMDNPHIAADGYSYELEAIEEWLRQGHHNSPVTNQKLKHRHLVPNNNLRFLIQDWRSSTS